MLALLKIKGLNDDDLNEERKDNNELNEQERKLSDEIESLKDKIQKKVNQLNSNNNSKDINLFKNIIPNNNQIENQSMHIKLGNPNIKLNTTLKGHFGKVQALAWGYQSNELVSASQDGKILVWNVLTGNKRLAISLSSAWTMCCDWSNDGTLIASGGLDNVCSIYNIENDSVGWVSKVYID